MTAARRNVATSARARWSVGIVVAGYFALAVVAGAPNSPLTVLLPARTEPPSWAATLARAAHLDRIGRDGLTAVAWIVVAVVLAAFALFVAEAWAGRVRLRSVLIGSAVSLAIAVAAPLLLSRDVYTYAAYGRIETLYHHNPYAAPLSSYPHDPFVAVASVQWLHSHSHYGPAFTLASAAIARWAGSVGTTILAFKALAGAAVAAATGLVALTAVKVRPERAALAAGLVGLNPVMVVHTVGGGHVDAWIAAPLAAGMALATARPSPRSAQAFAITVLLTLACLIKTVVTPVLALWFWWIVRASADRRGRTVSLHVAVSAALAFLSATPFLAGVHTLAPFGTLGGVEAWASPSHLVGRAAQAVARSLGGGARVGADTAHVVEVAFLLLYVGVLWRLARRTGSRVVVGADDWGLALLLLALSLPYVLPWYAAWFLPFLGLFVDRVVFLCGVLTTFVLALTLIPADPFHGVTTPAVMDGVHYGAASVLLVVLVVLVARAVRSDRSDAALRRAPLRIRAYAMSGGDGG
jgi:hypothetical protein